MWKMKGKINSIIMTMQSEIEYYSRQNLPTEQIADGLPAQAKY